MTAPSDPALHASSAVDPAALAVQLQAPAPALPAALIVIALVVLLAGFLLLLSRRYKRCPSNKILVIYGRTGRGQAAKTLHGGGAFVWPLIQAYHYLSLDPMQIEIPLQGALSMENIRVAVPSVFTVAIGTDEEGMNNAAVRLLGLSTKDIMKQAEDIIFGQLRQVIASMKIAEINRDRDVFLEKIQSSLEPELRKIGLVLINVNIRDITDESGYIEAIGRKAAAEAINQAQIDVADQERSGAIGVAEAEKEREIEVANARKARDIGTTAAERDRAVQVADMERERKVGEQTADFQREIQVRDAERQMRVRVAEANAQAVTGENMAKGEVAQANAELRVREADAYQQGETRHREAQAAVEEAQYRAQAKAAEAMAEKIEAEKRAELEAVARAVRAKTIVDAEASAERQRIEAEGEAKAIFARLDAQARGHYEQLRRKGEGLRTIIEASGGSKEAFQLLMLEHLDHLADTAAKAIANVKFDKVVVWDGGASGEGRGATAGFLRSLAGSLPPVMQMMRDVGGVDFPEFFARMREAEGPPARDPAEAGGPTGGDGQPGEGQATQPGEAKGPPPPKSAS